MGDGIGAHTEAHHRVEDGASLLPASALSIAVQEVAEGTNLCGRTIEELVSGGLGKHWGKIGA
jgi:hypothetical protein